MSEELPLLRKIPPLNGSAPAIRWIKFVMDAYTEADPTVFESPEVIVAFNRFFDAVAAFQYGFAVNLPSKKDRYLKGIVPTYRTMGGKPIPEQPRGIILILYTKDIIRTFLQQRGLPWDPAYDRPHWEITSEINKHYTELYRAAECKIGTYVKTKANEADRKQQIKLYEKKLKSAQDQRQRMLERHKNELERLTYQMNLLYEKLEKCNNNDPSMYYYKS